MTLRIFLTNKAKTDLLQISRYTEKRWGIVKRNEYLGNIDSVLNKLALNLSIGVECEFIKPGYYKSVVRRHVIYYKQSGNVLLVVRVLHHRMDVGRLD